MRWLLTRPLAQCDEWKKKLEAQGDEVILLPLIQILPAQDGGKALAQAFQKIDHYQWLIFASKNAAQAAEPYLKNPPRDLKIVSVDKEGVAGLISFFKDKKIEGEKILYPMSQIGRPELVTALRKQGAIVDVVEAYQTKPSDVTPQDMLKVLKQGIDAILFFSPSAVESFFSKIDPTEPLLKKISFAPIGKTTTQSLQSFWNNLNRPFPLQLRTP